VIKLHTNIYLLVSCAAHQLLGERLLPLYKGADKFLARPGRKKARATEDFDIHISYLLS
jgi:hypothetical protein